MKQIMQINIHIIHPLTVVPCKLHKLAELSVGSSLNSLLSAYPTQLGDLILLSYKSDEVFERSINEKKENLSQTELLKLLNALLEYLTVTCQQKLHLINTFCS